MSERIEAWAVCGESILYRDRDFEPNTELYLTYEDALRHFEYRKSKTDYHRNTLPPTRLVPESDNMQLRALKEIYVIAREFYLSDPSKWGRVLSWCEHAGCKWEEI